MKVGSNLGRNLIISINLSILLAIGVFPLLYSIYVSGHIWPLIPYNPPRWVGFENYQTTLTDPEFARVLFVTAGYVGGSLGIEVTLGFLLALLMQRELRLFTYLRAFFSIPILMAPVAAGLIWRFLYNPVYGPVTIVLQYAGLNPNFTGDPNLALAAVVIADVWQWTPFAFLVILSALFYVPREQYEAAEIDGASYLRKLRYVTLPSIKSIVGVLVLLRGVAVFGEMDKIFAITRGGPGIATTTLVYSAYQFFYYRHQIGESAAIAFIVVVLVNIFYILFSRYGIKLE